LAHFKKQYNPDDHAYVKLIARSKHLESLLLTNCSLNKNDADLLSLALDPTRQHYASNIKVLNLAKNNLDKEGAKVLARIFEINNVIENVDISKNKIGTSGAQEIAKYLQKNKSVKFLNLFNNKIAYDGAKAFGETFKVNNTLQFVEFGFNRIRNKGLLAIGDGIAANPNSGVKTLGLRFNFLSEDGLVDFIKTIFLNNTNAPKKLEEIFIKNNSINELGLFALKRSFDNLNIKKLNIDLFDKIKFLD